MLAIRWLAPVFGSAPATWALLISATLLAGSVGAYLGGRWAEGSPRALGTCFLAAGLAVALAALAAPQGVEVLLSLPILLGAGVGAVLLVTPIVLPLAAVLPQLLAEGGRETQTLGRAAGGLLAASTFGSLVGTLATALLGVPLVGVRVTALVLALLLLLCGGLRLMGRRGAPLALLPLVLLLFPEESRPESVLVRSAAPTGLLELEREGAGYVLRLDGIAQARSPSVWLDSGDLLRAGQDVVLLPHIRPLAQRALVVGLGGGLVGSALSAAGLEVEHLELDAALVEVTRKHLGFVGPVAIGDARALWRRTAAIYDAIVLDAFVGEHLPEHLLTREAFLELRERLAPGGVVVVHLVGTRTHPVVASVARTLRAAFAELMATGPAGSETLGDVFLFASDRRLRVPEDPALVEHGWRAERRFVPTTSGDLLTDDRSRLVLLHMSLAAAHRRASRLATAPGDFGRSR